MSSIRNAFTDACFAIAFSFVLFIVIDFDGVLEYLGRNDTIFYRFQSFWTGVMAVGAALTALTTPYLAQRLAAQTRLSQFRHSCEAFSVAVFELAALASGKKPIECKFLLDRLLLVPEEFQFNDPLAHLTADERIEVYRIRDSLLRIKSVSEVSMTMIKTPEKRENLARSCLIKICDHAFSAAKISRNPEVLSRGEEFQKIYEEIKSRPEL